MIKFSNNERMVWKLSGATEGALRYVNKCLEHDEPLVRSVAIQLGYMVPGETTMSWAEIGRSLYETFEHLDCNLMLPAHWHHDAQEFIYMGLEQNDRGIDSRDIFGDVNYIVLCESIALAHLEA